MQSTTFSPAASLLHYAPEATGTALLTLPPSRKAVDGTHPAVQQIVDKLADGKSFQTHNEQGFTKITLPKLQSLREELKNALLAAQGNGAQLTPSMAYQARHLRFAYHQVLAAVYGRFDAVELDQMCAQLETDQQQRQASLAAATKAGRPVARDVMKEMVALADEIKAARKAYQTVLGMEDALRMQKEPADTRNDSNKVRRAGLLRKWEEARIEARAKARMEATEQAGAPDMFADAAHATFADLGVVDIIERHCRISDDPAAGYLNGMHPSHTLHLRFGRPLPVYNQDDITFIRQNAEKADSDILVVGIPAANGAGGDRAVVFRRLAGVAVLGEERFRWGLLPRHGRLIDPRAHHEESSSSKDVLETFLKSHLADKGSRGLYFFTPQTAAVRDLMAQAEKKGESMTYRDAEIRLRLPALHTPEAMDESRFEPLQFPEQMQTAASHAATAGDPELEDLELLRSPHGGHSTLPGEFSPDILASPAGSSGYLALADDAPESLDMSAPLFAADDDMDDLFSEEDQLDLTSFGRR